MSGQKEATGLPSLSQLLLAFSDNFQLKPLSGSRNAPYCIRGSLSPPMKLLSMVDQPHGPNDNDQGPTKITSSCLLIRSEMAGAIKTVGHAAQ